MTVREIALETAITQLGVHEDAGNRNTGPQVNAYLASTGLPPGNSWCMSFCYWCYDQAAKRMAVKNPLAKTAGVLDQWNKRKTTNGTVTPNPGDIFIMDFGKGLGHTGIVEKIEGIWIYTIEGNSNDEGSREGYEVCRRRRDPAKMKGFLHFT